MQVNVASLVFEGVKAVFGTFQALYYAASISTSLTEVHIAILHYYHTRALMGSPFQYGVYPKIIIELETHLFHRSVYAR